MPLEKNPKVELLQHLLLKSIFENVVSAIIIGDDKGNVIEANEATCKIFGYTKAEFLATDRSDIIVMDAAVEKYLTERRLHGKAESVLNFKRKNNEVFKGKALSNVFTDDKGESYICFSIVDLSNEDKLQNLLNEVSRVANWRIWNGFKNTRSVMDSSNKRNS